ncbi:hypothetical protein [Ralstonia pickettii]|uniref:hypothetical protein n=1 Tax=Ralstonia pickettii TaxID=329 RepID=UPI002D78B860|nr:hypothetical protein [Ralstonia pickettii]
MLWKSGNIEFRIWPLDHCPPHVTAICRANNWTARFKFSMVTDTVSVWDIKPEQNAPTWTVINKLAGQVHKNLSACRDAWWRMQKTVCLDNAPVKRRGKKDVVVLSPGTAGSGRVVKGSGIYVSGKGVQARVNWGTSTTVELLTGV